MSSFSLNVLVETGKDGRIQAIAAQALFPENWRNADFPV
jgi:hypothetical protein